MTTNPTIDGVPRSTIEAILKDGSCKPEVNEAYMAARKELRALLDAPTCKECEGVGYHVTMGIQRSCWACKPSAQPLGEPVGSFDKHMQYMHENIALKRRIAELEATAKEQQWVSVEAFNRVSTELEELKAAQSKGVPVAWTYKRKDQSEFGKPSQHIAFASPDLEECRTGKNVEGRTVLTPRDDYFDWKPLYAEQPAPVALTQDAIDRIVPSLNPEPDRDEFHCEWALWSDRERIRNKLSTLLTANRAPVAVVMPERKQHVHQGLSHTDAKADGWNACLDELKRLNPSL